MLTPLLTVLASLSSGTVLGWLCANGVLGWLFIHPLKLPAGARMWMLLPLVACVAVVYRATRARTVREMPRTTVFTFANIVVGMILIAVAFYLVHAAARRWL